MRNRIIRALYVAGLMLGLGVSTSEAYVMPSTGMKVWLKADAITNLVDGNSVSNWPDSSGNGYGAANTATLCPTFRTGVLNGKPVVRFDGDNDYLINSVYSHGANDETLFVVVKTNGVNTAGYQTIFMGSPSSYTVAGSGFYQLYVDFGSILQGNFPAVATLKINSGIKPNGFQVMVLRKDNAGAGSSELYVDGYPRNSGTGTLALTSTKYIVGGWAGNDMNGDIAEVALYNTPLSTTDRQLAEGLLVWKYGLQGSLPAGHPWKNTDPAAFPIITNANPSFLSSTNAVLVGSLTATGASPVTVSVYWGTQDGNAPTSGLWQFTNTFAKGLWAEGSSPSTNVALPTPGIAYYYRFYATNDAGIGYASESQIFYGMKDVTWIQSAAGTHYWTNSANWSPAVVPNAGGLSIAITNDRAGAQFINVGQTITLGELIVGNTNLIVTAKLTGGSFRFDNGALNPRIVSTNALFTNFVDVVFGSGTALEISNSVSTHIVGSLAGFNNLVKQGAGVLLLYGANTYTGNFIVAGSGEIQTGSGTPTAYAVIPTTAWLELTNNATFKIGKSNQFFQGVRGIGSSYVNNDGSIVIGTNKPDQVNRTTRLFEGGKVSPGFGATTGDLILNNWSGGTYKNLITGGDLFIDITASGNDRIRFIYGFNEIVRGYLHLNFVAPYVPVKGAYWDVIVVSGAGGSITDTTPGDPLFTSIDSSIPGATFTAEIVGTTTVRVTLQSFNKGTLMIVR